MTLTFRLWFLAYFWEQIVKFCEGPFHDYVFSMLLCSRWVVLSGMHSALQRKHPWEQRAGTDIWDRRYPLTSSLSVCRTFAFSASLYHSSNIPIHPSDLAPHDKQGLTPARQLELWVADMELHDSPAFTHHSWLAVSWIHWLGWVWAQHKISKYT